MPGEPVDLLAAYKAALESGGLSACAPLLKLLEDAAENVNEDAYGSWLFKMRIEDASALDALLDAAAYAEKIG